MVTEGGIILNDPSDFPEIMAYGWAIPFGPGEEFLVNG
jgi:hypothetical protein